MLSRGEFSQRFLVVAFVSPEGNSNNRARMFKVRGVYDTHKAAEAACEHFRSLDGSKFNLFVGDVGRWLEFDPDPKTIENQVYADERLQNLMKGYLDNMEKGRKVHDDRIAETQRRAKLAPSMTGVMDRMNDTIDKIKSDRESASVVSDDAVSSSASASALPITDDSVNPSVPAVTDEQVSAARRRRLKKKLQGATPADIERIEQEIAERMKRVADMRDHIAKRDADTKYLANEINNDEACADVDVDDIRRMVDINVAIRSQQQN